MYSRARTYIPAEFSEQHFPLEAVAGVDLSVPGTRVEGLQAIEDLHQVLVIQGAKMLTAYDPEITPRELDTSLRNVRKTHKNEPYFFDKLPEGFSSSGLWLQTLVPYIPQYGWDPKLEELLGIDTRISFGLVREVYQANSEGPLVIFWAQINLWLSPDSQSPEPGAMKAHKDMCGITDLRGDRSRLETKLYSRERSRDKSWRVVARYTVAAANGDER